VQRQDDLQQMRDREQQEQREWEARNRERDQRAREQRQLRVQRADETRERTTEMQRDAKRAERARDYAAAAELYEEALLMLERLPEQEDSHEQKKTEGVKELLQRSLDICAGQQHLQHQHRQVRDGGLAEGRSVRSRELERENRERDARLKAAQQQLNDGAALIDVSDLAMDAFRERVRAHDLPDEADGEGERHERAVEAYEQGLVELGKPWGAQSEEVGRQLKHNRRRLDYMQRKRHELRLRTSNKLLQQARERSSRSPASQQSQDGSEEPDSPGGTSTRSSAGFSSPHRAARQPRKDLVPQQAWGRASTLHDQTTKALKEVDAEVAKRRREREQREMKVRGKMDAAAQVGHNNIFVIPFCPHFRLT